MKSFEEVSLYPEIQKALTLLGYDQPTPVQAALVPLILQGRDAVVESKTGSGKTAAFGIPLAQLVDWEENAPQVLVLTPTRELAIQVKEEIFNIGRFRRLKVSALYGKSSFRHQVREIAQKTHVVTGTPGRVLDHLQRETMNVSQVRYLVIDEADEMLEMGFMEQVEEILSFLPEKRMTVLVSATMPREVEELAQAYMRDPALVRVAGEETLRPLISQEAIRVNEEEEKYTALEAFTVLENPDTCMIFCNTRKQVEEVYRFLRKAGYSCGKLHGEMEQEDRTKTMAGFKRGRFRYLVATDVAARGIDVSLVNLVINFDFPRDPEDYVHRIGRTGRIGNLGKALSLIDQGEERLLKKALELLGTGEVLWQELPDGEEIEALKHSFMEKNRQKPTEKSQKGAKLEKDIMLLHINAGKKTKMRTVDVVGTLCSIPGMTAEDVGVIRILDVSTFVEVLNGKGEMVLRALQEKPIKGRLRKVKDETGKDLL